MVSVATMGVGIGHGALVVILLTVLSRRLCVVAAGLSVSRRYGAAIRIELLVWARRWLLGGSGLLLS